ncbi:GIY-YIG nuclease family protein [Trueperella bialowiezensis]|uniref:T5orf172 domain n=1 Tax=Trueperella bialowiezensis TaxID=312285 RepID=A0A3S4WH91_9ACTO|nr:GIY-YIG nuclease family protein [Trueperella bialowiezensis]VEI13889.1 T5orf172 domain [Trueperella bialowiezensis]
MSSEVEKNIAAQLDQLIADDTDGLLKVDEKPKRITSDDRLERSFLEIVEFYERESREPSSTTRDIAERKLGARLFGIRANPEKKEALAHLDTVGLLREPEAPASIDDILADDSFGLLDDDTGILDTSTLPEPSRTFDIDERAQRIRAEDFAEYEHLFKQKHRELKDGASQLMPYTGIHQIQEGRFFVLQGVMVFIAEVGETEASITAGKLRRRQRLRAIFENGTESALYRQSLAIRLKEKEGFVVINPTMDLERISEDDELGGYVYVLRSLSRDPEVSSIPNLHKIGFSRGPVEERVKDAASDPTFLMADVEIVATYRVYNVKASAIEHLLHRVFAEVRLDIRHAINDGATYDPSEWFVVPLDAIDDAVSMIESGDIVDYHYNRAAGRLIES